MPATTPNMTGTDLRVRARSNASQRIIAGGIVLVFLYYAASVIMTVVLAMLLAYFLDPLVEWLEGFRFPRALGSLLVVLLMVALVAAAISGVWFRVTDFVNDWPKYSVKLRAANQAVEKYVQKIEQGVLQVAPEEPKPRNTIRIEEPRTSQIHTLLLQGLGSITSVLLASSFVPFLVFFMLTAKRDVWHATLQLFPPKQRTQVKETLEKVGEVLRGYVMGNFFVALILGGASAVFFWLMDLDYPLLAGGMSGTLNLVPYFGTLLSWIPPIVLGLTKWNSIGPFLVIIGVLTFYHLLALNFLFPALVGRKVRLNPLAVTLALLFWGWLWGGMGFLLGIPITASIKVICDHVEGWEPVGRWLSA